MPEQEKTREQLQQEALQRMQNAEYMNEVAMPGISRPVNPEDVNK